MLRAVFAVVAALVCFGVVHAESRRAAADTYVRGGVFADAAFGSATTLVMSTSLTDEQYNRTILMRFTTIPKTAVSALLTLYPSTVANLLYTTTPIKVCRTFSTTWQEDAVTFKTNPETDSTACVSKQVSDWTVPVQINVTSLLFGDVLSIAMMFNGVSNGAVEFYSDEATSSKPDLSTTDVTDYNARGVCPGPFTCYNFVMCNCSKPSADRCKCGSGDCCSCGCGDCAQRCQYFDAQAPTMEFTGLAPQISQFPSTIPVALKFNEHTNFVASHLSTTNCDSVVVSGGPTAYVVYCSYTSTSQSTTIAIGANAVQDAYGNTNQAGATITLTPAIFGVPTITFSSSVTAVSNQSPILIYVHTTPPSTLVSSKIQTTNCASWSVSNAAEIPYVLCTPATVDAVIVTLDAGAAVSYLGVPGAAAEFAVRSEIAYSGEGYCGESSSSCFGNHICDCIAPSFGACSCNTTQATCCNCGCGTCSERCADILQSPLWTAAKQSPSSILFNGRSLDGTLPTELGELTATTVINFGSNFITGTIPSQLGLLTALTSLNLETNLLTGTIPDTLGLLTRLKELRLRGNALSGSIPSSVLVLALTTLEVDFVTASPTPSSSRQATASPVPATSTSTTGNSDSGSSTKKILGIRQLYFVLGASMLGVVLLICALWLVHQNRRDQKRRRLLANVNRHRATPAPSLGEAFSAHSSVNYANDNKGTRFAERPTVYKSRVPLDASSPAQAAENVQQMNLFGGVDGEVSFAGSTEGSFRQNADNGPRPVDMNFTAQSFYGSQHTISPSFQPPTTRMDAGYHSVVSPSSFGDAQSHYVPNPAQPTNAPLPQQHNGQPQQQQKPMAQSNPPTFGSQRTPLEFQRMQPDVQRGGNPFQQQMIPQELQMQSQQHASNNLPQQQQHHQQQQQLHQSNQPQQLHRPPNPPHHPTHPGFGPPSFGSPAHTPMNTNSVSGGSISGSMHSSAPSQSAATSTATWPAPWQQYQSAQPNRHQAAPQHALPHAQVRRVASADQLAHLTMGGGSFRARQALPPSVFQSTFASAPHEAPRSMPLTQRLHPTQAPLQLPGLHNGAMTDRGWQPNHNLAQPTNPSHLPPHLRRTHSADGMPLSNGAMRHSWGGFP